MAQNHLCDKAPGKPTSSICRENKVDGTAVLQGDYMQLLFIGFEDTSSTPSTSATVARGDYRLGEASDKLGPLLPRRLMKVKVKMRLPLVDLRLQGS